MTITMEDRLRAMQIVGELVKPQEDFFDAALASELIDLIPVTKDTGVGIKYRGGAKSGGETSGFAAGVGNVNIPDDEKRKKLKWNWPEYEAVGDVKIKHTLGLMKIEQMWDDTYGMGGLTGSSCVLEYDKNNNQPIELKLAAEKVFSLPFLGPLASWVTYVSWKQPRFEG